MKAVVVHQYGGPEVLKFEDYPDPVPGPGEVLVRVAATSVNPLDYKRRAGLMKDFPIQFPGLIGTDISGTVVKTGPGVEGLSAGDQVFSMADNTYAELCVVKAAVLAKVPKGLDLIRAAALPLVTITGNQLMSATGVKAGQTVLVIGAVGNVGRSAVFTAKARGATVIAGVLKKQIDEAKTVGADQVVATDDDTAIANLPPLDAVADTVGGRTAEKLIAKVKPGGVFASVVGKPRDAAKYPAVKAVFVFSKFDRKTLEFMAEAVRDGKLVIPISQTLPLREAAEAQATAEKGSAGKILLVARRRRTFMRPIAYLLVAAASMASIAGYTVNESKQANGEPAPVFVTQIPSGYRDFMLISVAHEAGNLNSLGAVLGNDVAIKAYRDKTLPYPDGTIIAALHYRHSPSEENDKIFGQPQSFVPGAPTNIQFMIKDSQKYAATGGWGFGHFSPDGKPGAEALMSTCFPCHAREKARDLVFTQYAP